MLVAEKTTELIIGAAVKVHRELGPGLLESVYEVCLAHEIAKSGLKVQKQIDVPIRYDDCELDCGFRIDLLIDDEVIVELKAVEKVLPVHEAQLMTYLKLANKRVGLLINFNVVKLTNGITRRVI
ncbi:MAG: GxxExxY protein [Planctomycetes bacterium]|nr:GxxExxY protein [Planctomycetota bacterium]